MIDPLVYATALRRSVPPSAQCEEDPLVSIVIRNHNGGEFVVPCLASVLNTNYSNYEIVFVDDASTDGSLESVKGMFGGDERLRIIRNERNLGIAGTANSGAKVAKGEYVVFLDNDTEVDPDWIKELVEVMRADQTVGAEQSKLLRLRNRNIINCAGVFIDPLGLPHVMGIDEVDRGQYDFIYEIFCAVGNAITVRKTLFDRLGGFDEDFFVHLDDDDLCWRIWLSGHRVVFSPKSVVFHGPSAALTKLSQEIKTFHLWKNSISMIIKNYELRNLIRYLFLGLSFAFASAVYHTLLGHLNGIRVYLMAIRWGLLNFRSIYLKRTKVQRFIRKVDDSKIKSMFVRKLLFVT